jgi:ABC-type proline/glycine betaine transport system permease subunit
VDTGIMLAGAIPTALLAVIANWILGQTEKLIVSKGLVKE